MSSARIFGDEIFTATDLNRRPGQVLDEARRRPVTITRNDETFALLLRKDAARMVEAAINAQLMVEISKAAYEYLQTGQPIRIEHPFEWLNALDKDELKDFLTEAHRDFRRALNEEISWADFEAVIHEWHESGIAVRSEALAEAFSAPTDEVALTPPAITDECSPDA